MEQDLASLRRFSEVMRQTHAPHRHRRALAAASAGGIARARARELPPEVEDLLPEYPLWLQHGEVVDRLHSALADLGEELCFAKHPLRWLGKGVLQADRPLEALSKHLDQAEDLLDAIESALELSGLPGELWDTFEEIQAILEFAVRARPLGRTQSARRADARTRRASLRRTRRRPGQEGQGPRSKRRRKPPAGRNRSRRTTRENALAQAQAFEKSIFRFLQPAFWRLKKTLQSRYDFRQHAVAPAWSKILRDLVRAAQGAGGTGSALRSRRRKDWRTEDVEAFRAQVAELRTIAQLDASLGQGAARSARASPTEAGCAHRQSGRHSASVSPNWTTRSRSAACGA